MTELLSAGLGAVVGIVLAAVFAPLLIMLIEVFTWKPYWESKEWKERKAVEE